MKFSYGNVKKLKIFSKFVRDDFLEQRSVLVNSHAFGAVHGISENNLLHVRLNNRQHPITPLDSGMNTFFFPCRFRSCRFRKNIKNEFISSFFLETLRKLFLNF